MKIPAALSVLKEGLHSGMESMERATENAQKRMEQFSRGEDRKPSVKAELKRIKSEKPAKQKVQQMMQEQAR